MKSKKLTLSLRSVRSGGRAGRDRAGDRRELEVFAELTGKSHPGNSTYLPPLSSDPTAAAANAAFSNSSGSNPPFDLSALRKSYLDQFADDADLIAMLSSPALEHLPDPAISSTGIVRLRWLIARRDLLQSGCMLIRTDLQPI